MTHWFKSLRLSITLLAGFLTIISFKLVHHLGQALLPTIVVIVIACATMVQNDWRDRINDRKKGKTLAYDKSHHFFLWVILWWGAAIALVVYGWRTDPAFGILPTLAILVGMVYSEIRRIPLISLLLTALTSAGPVLFPTFLGFGSPLLIWLFIVTFVLILSREVIKDIDDVMIDRGYKKTLPILVGVFKARIIASLLIVGSGLIAWMVFNLWIELPLLLCVILYLVTYSDPETTKQWLDFGILAALIQLFFTAQ